jgi:hypothetical protein
MFLLEAESKFKIRRPRNPTEVLRRVDKYIDFSLASLENNDEMRYLKELCRLMFFIPFEVNAKAALNL